LTTDEAVQILERYIDWEYCSSIDALPLKDWLATDIVRMIELMDAELQRRAEFAEAAKAAVYDDYDFGIEFAAGHDPDLDENGRCRICGQYEPE
jgi:hypothetical protein